MDELICPVCGKPATLSKSGEWATCGDIRKCPMGAEWWTLELWNYHPEIDRLRAELEQVKAQRDELLEACKLISNFIYDSDLYIIPLRVAEFYHATEVARVAIAKAEGKP